MLNIEKATPELFASLVKAQATIENAVKSVEGQEGNRKFLYATFPDIIDGIKPHLTKQGLTVIQSTSFSEGIVTVDTVIVHELGGSIQTKGTIPCEQSGAKAVGSATSYLRKYQVQALFFVASEDDDGKEADGKASKTEIPKPDKITPDQVVQLNELVKACGTNINTVAFLGNFKIKSIPQMSVVQFPQALSMLNKKIAGLQAQANVIIEANNQENDNAQ